jgi:hypothetical protein
MRAALYLAFWALAPMFFASQTWLYGLCSAHPTRFADAARDPVTDATGASS